MHGENLKFIYKLSFVKYFPFVF